MMVLFDGWPLVYQPNSPEALHLLGILARRPAAVHATLALPGEPPSWLPQDVAQQTVVTDGTPRARLAWEQRTLPSLRQRLGADLLHLTTPNPPLFGPSRNVVSPCVFDEAPRSRKISERLRNAASQGGMSRLAGLLWPEDLPSPDIDGAVFRLPPAVYPGIQDAIPNQQTLELPETFVLYHGPAGSESLRLLLSAWSWAAGSLGDAYPLVALGFNPIEREQLSAMAASYQLGDSVRSLPALSPAEIAETYRRSTALFHPASEPVWGGPVRMALASGTPAVAIESKRSDAIAGPAAYLVRGDSRLLGAALITVLVEEEIAEKLSQAGKQRAVSWSLGAFGEGLLSTYKRIIDGETFK